MCTNKLFIHNIDSCATEDHILSLFSIWGDVTRLRINKSKGYGFIEMTSSAEARQAKEKLSGQRLWGRSLEIKNVPRSISDVLRYRLGLDMR